uniref:Uncharacterized protein n=1 Tax=Kalanchoe fedtschenkoi TaxID=63787 RepID=A0A7N0SXE3_KALFE
MSSKSKQVLSGSCKIFRREMCYEVKCSTCGKTTWGGCGRHVSSVYRGIAEGQHCGCRDWPGVKKVSDGGSSAAEGGVSAAGGGGGSTCNIL